MNGIKQLTNEEQIAWQYQCVREDWIEESDKQATHVGRIISEQPGGSKKRADGQRNHRR
jgi:hypothetical protein